MTAETGAFSAHTDRIDAAGAPGTANGCQAGGLIVPGAARAAPVRLVIPGPAADAAPERTGLPAAVSGAATVLGAAAPPLGAVG